MEAHKHSTCDPEVEFDVSCSALAHQIHVKREDSRPDSGSQGGLTQVLGQAETP